MQCVRFAFVLGILVLSTGLPAPLATAQRTAENVVTAAKDAFGTSIGNERIGLYSSSDVRGFSPLDAGNVRIEGFAFDLQGTLNSRLVAGADVHVGITAQGYPFPAPTGIVDYRLRKADDALVVSVLTGLGDFGGPFAELDAKLPIIPERVSLAAGMSYALDEYYDGSDARVASFAFTPRFRPTASLEILPFWSFTASRGEEVAPYIVTSGAHLPPRFPRRRYYGQPWADLDLNVTNLGLLVKSELGDHWEIAGALFHSRRAVLRDYAELFVGTAPDGTTLERVIADPPQLRASSGGELSVTFRAAEGPRLHQLRARVSGRLRQSAIGGSSMAIDLGARELGTPAFVPQPEFEFRARSEDRLRQWTVGLAYEGRWKDVAELVLGVQRTDYRKTVEMPELPRSTSRSEPWLLNGALAWHATDVLAVYAGYTRGLEEVGIAPGHAANRNQVLPAILTEQFDGGLRLSLAEKLRVVAGVFQVRKPYLTTNAENVFAELGEVRHPGIELSCSGEVLDGLSIVAGAVLMRPRVRGPAVDDGRVQPGPVGQTERVLRLNVNYSLPWPTGLSLDLGVLHTAERFASSEVRLTTPAVTTLDVGARFRFSIADRPVTLRVQATNLTDAYGYRVLASNTFRTNSPRSIIATLAIDL